MNLISEIVKMLGVEIGQEFNIILADESKSKHNPFFFKDDGLYLKGNEIKQDMYLALLVRGTNTIEIIPFKPKYEEIYWYWSNSDNKAKNCWFDEEDNVDLIYWKIGNCFRTKEEAETKGKQLMEQLFKEYKNGE